ncbi:MAG: hypothetical protein AAF939_14720 [Planctomycetota bacterium]
MLYFIVFTLTFPNLWGNPNPHELPDGFVERTMAVIVRDQTAFVEYRIGLNNQTMANLLNEWSNSEKTDSGDPAQKPLDDQTDLEKPGLTTDTEQDQPIADSKLFQPLQKSKSNSADYKIPSEDEDVHWLDPQKLSQFKSQWRNRIVKKLKVVVSNKPVVIEHIKEGPPTRHPFYASIQFEIPIANRGEVGLKIEDHQFLNQSGAVRYSLKASGIAMILKSNVAPNLVRSKRIELDSLDLKAKIEAGTIMVRLGIPTEN